jgi:hypothetical protein
MTGISKDLVVTNVTEVKAGQYGLRVTINGYEKEIVDASNDDIYMITLGINNEILQKLVDQVGTGDIISKKREGDRINLPNGIRVRVECGGIASSSPRTKYVNQVTAINFLGAIQVEFEKTIPVNDITFTDWGVVFQTMDQEYIDDKIVILAPLLPEKVSSIMETFKASAKNNIVKIKVKTRVYYATYPDRDERGRVLKWNVKTKHRFDSRFDDPSLVTVSMEIPGMKTMYVDAIKKMKEAPQFKAIIKLFANSWAEKFIGENEMVKIGKLSGIDIDTTMIASLFIDKRDQDAYTLLKSFVPPEGDTIYHAKKNGFKYVVFRFPALPDPKSTDRQRVKIVLFDVTSEIAYGFIITESFIETFLKTIETTGETVFLDRAVTMQGQCNAVGKVNTAGNQREWTKKLWNDLSMQSTNIS